MRFAAPRLVQTYKVKVGDSRAPPLPSVSGETVRQNWVDVVRSVLRVRVYEY